MLETYVKKILSSKVYDLARDSAFTGASADSARWHSGLSETRGPPVDI